MEQVGLHEYCEEARPFIQSAEPERAIRIARHILRRYPHHVESYRLLGQALLATGNYQEADRQFRRVLSADPEDVASRVGLARIHQAHGDLDKAMWQLGRALDVSPSDPGLHAQLGQLQARQGDGTPQEAEMTRAALGRIHLRGGLYAKAIQEFKAALEQSPDRADIQLALAEALWRAGRRPEAVEVCQSILGKLPNALKANLILGVLWLDSEEPGRAEPYLKSAQELDPESRLAYSLLGDASPLPTFAVTVERLGEDAIQLPPPEAPPAPPAERVLAAEEAQPVAAGRGRSIEEVTTPMNEEPRPEEETEVPDWLQGVGDDLTEDKDSQPAASPSQDVSGAGEKTPGWLQKLVARATKPGGPKEGPPPAPAGSGPEPGIPDWLAAIMAGRPAEEPAPAPPTVEKPEAEQPFEAVAAAPAPPAAEPEIEEVGLGEGVERLAAVEAEEEMPAGLTGLEEAEPAVLEPWAEQAEELELPEWLGEISAEEEAPRQEAAEIFAEVEVDESGLPDWLRGFEELEAEPRPETPFVSIEPAAEPATAEEGQALWEKILAEEGVELASVEEELPPEAVGMTAEEWLRSTQEGILAPPAAPETLVEQPLPEEPELAPIAAEAPAGPEEIALPDWLLQVTAEEETPAEEAEPLPSMAGLPDWLRELQEPAEEIEPAAPEIAPAAPPMGELPEAVEAEAEVEIEAGLPDWLEERLPEAAALAEEEPTPSLHMPDWLSEFEAEEGLLEAADVTQAPAMESEVPDWLGEIIAGATPPAEPWDVEPEVTITAEAGAEEEEAIPAWLRDFHELEEEEALAELPESRAEEPLTAAVVDVEGLELPAWLVQLREGAAEPEPSALTEYEVAEVEAAAPEMPSEEALLAVEMAPEPEVLELEAAGPAWLADLVPAREGLPEEEIEIEEEAVPLAERPVEAVVAEVPIPAEVAEPALAAEPVPTRKLEAVRVEDLPKDAAARLSMARSAQNAGDWSEALTIYETLVSSTEMLDSVIDNLKVGIRRHPDDPNAYQLLGDACVRHGRLQDALQAYRSALTKL